MTASRCRAGDEVGRRARAGARAAHGRTDRAELPPAAVRHRHPDPRVRRCRRRPHHGPRHAEDHADAARAGEVRRQVRRRHQPPRRALRRHAHQGQPRAAGRRGRGGRSPRSRADRPDLRVEIEAQTLEEVDEALAPAPTSSWPTTWRSTTFARPSAASRGRAKVEISGGVTLERMPELAATGADYVSVGGADAFGACRRHQLRDRAALNAAACRSPAARAARTRSTRARAAWDGWALRGAYYRDRLVPPTMSRRSWPVARREPASAAEGAVVIADAQTAGRGRRGRSWFSPPEAACTCRRCWRRAHAVSPERATPLADARGRRRAGRGHRTRHRPGRADIKWPNDLLVGRRKLAGILAEGLAAAIRQPALARWCSATASTSVTMSVSADLLDRATSLETELGRPVDRAALAAESLAALARRYDDLLAGRFDAILDAWRRRSPSSAGRASRGCRRASDRHAERHDRGHRRYGRAAGALVARHRPRAGR